VDSIHGRQRTLLPDALSDPDRSTRQSAELSQQRDPFRTLVLPVLRDCPALEIAERVKLDPTAVRRIQSGRSVPRSAHKAALLAFAAERVRNALQEWGIILPTGDLACCATYIDADSTGRAGLLHLPKAHHASAHGSL